MEFNHAAFDTVPDALLVIGRDGIVLYANHHAESLFGFGKGELAGGQIGDLIPERYRSNHAALFAGYVAEPMRRPMGEGREFPALLRDGTEILVEIALGPGRHPGTTVVVVRDITESQRTRSELLKQTERLKSFLTNSSEAIWCVGFEEPIPLDLPEMEQVNLMYRGASIIEANHAFAASYGATVEETIGWPLERLVPRDKPASIEFLVRAVRSNYRMIDAETRETDVDGGEVIFLNNFIGTFEDDKVVRVWGTSRIVTELRKTEERLKQQNRELKQLRDRLSAEAEYLQSEIRSEHNFEEIVGNSGAILATLHKVDQVAGTDSTVLLLGETGTGKELLARAIHSRSSRKSRAMVKVDCSALPAGLIESELFGHTKGAFTGAHETRAGRFELADGGTIFLDEIGELPLDLQSKLLRVLEEGCFQRLGSQKEQEVDVRIIAATNRDLRTEISEGRFRSDLYYRLGVFMIESPPLRDRREDIPLLVSFFMSRFASTLGKKLRSIEKKSLKRMVAYDWPGNIRELRNVVERSAILSSGEQLVVRDSLEEPGTAAGAGSDSLKKSLAGVERARIIQALQDSNWKVKGDGNAASRLGLEPSTLRSRMKRLGIQRP